MKKGLDNLISVGSAFAVYVLACSAIENRICWIIAACMSFVFIILAYVFFKRGE